MRGFILFVSTLLVLATGAMAQKAKYVVMISIDGFRPDFYLDKSWPAPNMQLLKEKGVHATGVRGVFPTITYPSHTTLITGVAPAKHGIYYNTPFEPEGASGRWYSESSAIKTETLWDAVGKAGMISAAVSWPVSVGAPVTYNIPETFSLKNPGDRRAPTSEQSTPKGLFEEVQRYATGELQSTDLNLHYLGMNETLSRMAAYLIGRYKPNLLTVHLPCTDEVQHREGREGMNVPAAVASADHGIGTILEAIEKAGIGDSTAIIITGDHGFVDIHTSLAPNVWLAQKGLTGSKNNPGSWKAMFHSGGGSTFLKLKDKNDQKTLQQVKDMLNELPAGIRKQFTIIEQPALSKSGADPDAVLALTAVQGISFSSGMNGEAVKKANGGAHGYFPDFREIQTGFIGFGAGLEEKVTVPVLGLEDIAPLVAKLLGITLKEADGVLYPGMLKK
ncbi:alkaline phosphatase family protein [Chitinophaga ginsengisegetis]|uniref:alkaline phosphatase family protein n=1 Tax=Chitinophaga ginsengisegetis TaxID=393003 RepID=UPI000DBAA16D|nr:ectonucleotide pyrophosphatase/phosphodiesterase [Chitinophaga ginsengisegetis]MDR6568763.1 putative AlkP superfamily pyrophosphatase or phosphodiesterase [Chitinophaga ginsengisegetis]MDR6648006.1 putative AlkP superfamily pyrophosphatase or phosphodiesterase [Chitinophaga ginsengisegetis]MDR6654844.1 putative AlkP superfamily pyrophosphatase or phosphodiesterase [Chitinophaga ginsengisegetis]